MSNFGKCQFPIEFMGGMPRTYDGIPVHVSPGSSVCLPRFVQLSCSPQKRYLLSLPLHICSPLYRTCRDPGYEIALCSPEQY